MDYVENATVPDISDVSFERILNADPREKIDIFCPATDISKYVMCLVLVILMCDVFTIVSIISTKRIPFAPKLLISITLICNSLFLVICMIAHGAGFTKPISWAILTELVRIVTVVSWTSVTILSLERVMCLYHPNLYTRIANKRTITKVVIVGICLTLCIKLSVRYLLIPLIMDDEFNFIQATKNSELIICFLGACLFINTVCYIAIFRVVKKLMKVIESLHITGSQSTDKHFVSTRNITCIIVVFQLVHNPLFISVCVNAFTENNSGNTRISALFMLIMCTVNPVLYAWRLKECRYVMFRFVGKAFNIFDKKIEVMRIEVYDITVQNV
ncbi:uncharacterized protein LOC132744653 [Ruditapes philippinarum]|uniref:uncharacterized protein LOC132744653 n=1 Tax=Ruditapes philippinarum TaxID=129788 RepID=UPI00295BA543|nr:uncharacterized protein LOC132744653 [Ruditapes philippinarum]